MAHFCWGKGWKESGHQTCLKWHISVVEASVTLETRPKRHVSGAQGGSGDSQRQNIDTENVPKWMCSSCLAIETLKTYPKMHVFNVSMGGEWKGKSRHVAHTLRGVCYMSAWRGREWGQYISKFEFKNLKKGRRTLYTVPVALLIVPLLCPCLWMPVAHVQPTPVALLRPGLLAWHGGVLVVFLSFCHVGSGPWRDMGVGRGREGLGKVGEDGGMVVVVVVVVVVVMGMMEVDSPGHDVWTGHMTWPSEPNKMHDFIHTFINVYLFLI